MIENNQRRARLAILNLEGRLLSKQRREMTEYFVAVSEQRLKFIFLR